MYIYVIYIYVIYIYVIYIYIDTYKLIAMVFGSNG